MSLSLIRGQEEALNSLRAFLEKDKFPQSLILIGPPGSGKKFASIQIAKALICKVSKNDACGQCADCLKVEKQQHPDVKVIGKIDSEHIKIEQVRLLKEQIGLKPYEADKKVFVVQDIHDMTEEAANAFLKTLEEPQSASFLILTARADRFILPTILSRCQKIKFNPLSSSIIQEILVANGLPSDQAKVISKVGGSDLSWMLIHRDNIISLRDNLLKSLLSSSSNIFLGALGRDRNAIEEDKLRIYLKVALSIFRDGLIVKSGYDSLINADKKDEIQRISENYSQDDFLSIIAKIDELNKSWEQNINLKLVWDLFFSQLNSLQRRAKILA